MPSSLTPDLISSYYRLIQAHVASELPRTSAALPQPPSDRELARLLFAAGALALSSDGEERSVAFEIATRVVQVLSPVLPSFVQAAQLVLTRLGNFPGRQLLRDRYPDSAVF